jgi:hypothetical protein
MATLPGTVSLFILGPTANSQLVSFASGQTGAVV